MLTRKNVAAGILIVVSTLTFVAGAAQAENKNVITIPKLDGIKIDGDLSDWGDRGYRVEYMMGDRLEPVAPGNCGVKMRYAWDDKGLLVAFDVTDDEPKVDGDSVRITLVRVAEDGSYRFTVSMSADANNPTRIETRRQAGYGLPGKDTPGEAVMNKTARGFVTEMRISLENLGLEPKEGTAFEPLVRVVDVDKGQLKETLTWQPRVVDTETGRCVMVLGKTTSQPQVIDVMSEMSRPTSWHVIVAGPKELAGKKVVIEASGRKVAESQMEARLGQAMADVTIPVTYGQGKMTATATVAGKYNAAFPLEDADVARASAIQGMNVEFEPYCFSGVRFPKCDLGDWALAEKLLGKYKIDVTYYDPNYTKVENSTYPGRYGVVIEITPEKGPKLISYRTICKLKTSERLWNMQADAKARLPFALGLDEQTVARHSEELGSYLWGALQDNGRSDGAVLLAGIDEAKGKNIPADELYGWSQEQDRRWWLGFKRKTLGLDKIYDKPFECPRKVEGLKATVVHEGTLADAGMKADAVEKIDAACKEWVANSDQEFSVCIVRHGAVVLNKGYGMRDGKPLSPDERNWMASITKLMSSTLMMEFVDQGLVVQDERVDKYLPQLRGIKVKKPLTIRRLYNHTNGMEWVNGWDTDHDFEEKVAECYPLLGVGKEYSYNGNGFALGGKVMESISGEALPALYRKHLLRPLGCTNTRVIDTAGSTMSTPMDMAKIGQMLLNKGAYGDMRFFSEETFAKMLPLNLTPMVERGTTREYGMGCIWYPDDGLGKGVFGHGAASAAVLRICPEYDMVIVVCRNRGGANQDKYQPQFFKVVVAGIEK
jgi:CubicO group peptidase (beta-lactamase class C family)